MRATRKTPRYEVISVRVTKERRALLERYRNVLSDGFGRAVSMGEAVFLVMEDRVDCVERVTARHELHHDSAAALYHIRQRWASDYTLSAAEWDLLAEYVQIATEAARHEPPHVRPVLPSSQSYLALLDAFEAVYQNRATCTSPYAWAYVANLGGGTTAVTTSADDPDQRHQTVLTQIAHRRDLLRTADAWPCAGNLGSCLRTAIRQEGIDSTRFDQLLAPYWPTLWGLAARGHWLRHRQPVRLTAARGHVARQPLDLQCPITRGDLTLSFVPSADSELVTEIDFGSLRRFRYRIEHYPELMEFRAMLDNRHDESWFGRQVFALIAKDQRPPGYSLRLKHQELRIDVSAREWSDLRDLFQQAWQRQDLQWWLARLRDEYGEHG